MRSFNELLNNYWAFPFFLLFISIEINQRMCVYINLISNTFELIFCMHITNI